MGEWGWLGIRKLSVGNHSLFQNALFEPDKRLLCQTSGQNFPPRKKPSTPPNYPILEIKHSNPCNILANVIIKIYILPPFIFSNYPNFCQFPPILALICPGSLSPSIFLVSVWWQNDTSSLTPLILKESNFFILPL